MWGFRWLNASAHTFDVARIARRQISQDITFSVWWTWPRFTFCFSNKIIHTRGGEVYSVLIEDSHAGRGEAFPRKRKKIQSRSQSYCAFWTKGTMRLATGRFGQQHWGDVEKIPSSTFLSFLGTRYQSFSSIFSCRKYPWEATNRIREGSCVGAQRGCVRRCKPNPTKRTASFLCAHCDRITAAVSNNSQGIKPLSLCFQPRRLSAALALTDPGRWHIRASPHPLRGTRQTPIHPTTDCLSAAAAALTVGSSHFLISRLTWIQPRSCFFARQTHSCSLSFREPRTLIAKAHTSAFSLCVNGAQKERRQRAPELDKDAGRENKREERRKREGGRGEPRQKDILSFRLYWVRWCQPLMNSPVGCCYREGRKNKTLLYEQRAPPHGPQELSSCWINSHSTGLEGGQLLI